MTAYFCQVILWHWTGIHFTVRAKRVRQPRDGWRGAERCWILIRKRRIKNLYKKNDPALTINNLQQKLWFPSDGTARGWRISVGSGHCSCPTTSPAPPPHGWQISADLLFLPPIFQSSPGVVYFSFCFPNNHMCEMEAMAGSISRHPTFAEVVFSLMDERCLVIPIPLVSKF